MEEEKPFELSESLSEFKDKVGDVAGKTLESAKESIKDTFKKLGIRVQFKAGPFSIMIEPVKIENENEQNRNNTKEIGQQDEEELSL